MKNEIRGTECEHLRPQASISAALGAAAWMRVSSRRILPAPPLGRALRRWRILHAVKQAHAAELLGVTQSTISRWERGLQEMEPAERRKVEPMVSARLDAAADRALARLVETSSRPIHLVCDLTHRLLAVSPARAGEFNVSAIGLIGESLWPFITEELAETEASLKDLGWYDLSLPPDVEAETGANGSEIVPIRPSRCRWTRIVLSDGAAARLVETIT